MTDIEKMAAIHEIHALKARYFRTMDTKDWAGHEAVFAPGLVADFRDTGHGSDETQLHHGAAAYVPRLAAMLEGVATVHHGHTPEIEILSADEATGIWAMEDRLWVSPGSSLPFRWLHGHGHYHERYVRLAQGWRIAATRLTRLRVDQG